MGHRPTAYSRQASDYLGSCQSRKGWQGSGPPVGSTCDPTYRLRQGSVCRRSIAPDGAYAGNADANAGSHRLDDPRAVIQTKVKKKWFDPQTALRALERSESNEEV